MRFGPRALRHFVGLFDLVDDPDPRLLQTAFAALVALDTVLRALVGTPLGRTVGPVVGLSLLALVTAAVWLAPRARPSTERAALVVGVLDLAVIGMVRLVPEGSAAGILVVLPALWLAGTGERAERHSPGWAPRSSCRSPGWPTTGSRGRR